MAAFTVFFTHMCLCMCNKVKRLCNEHIKREVYNVESAMSMVCCMREDIQIDLEEVSFQ